MGQRARVPGLGLSLGAMHVLPFYHATVYAGRLRGGHGWTRRLVLATNTLRYKSPRIETIEIPKVVMPMIP